METKAIREILISIGKIREKKAPILTNYYFSYNGSNELFDVIEADETIIFCIQEIGVYRIFYYSCNEKELSSLLAAIPDGAILDIVSKEEQLSAPWVESAGFRLYNTYGRFGNPLPNYEEQKVRMSQKWIDTYYNDNYGEYALEEDLAEIQKKIWQGFDVKTDHFFSDQQMLELIRNHLVYVHRDTSGIICIVIYRIEGKKLYYNLTYNEGTADVSYSIEKKILLNSIKNYGVNYVYSWIALTNKKALKRNGAPSDHLYNYIYEKTGGVKHG